MNSILNASHWFLTPLRGLPRHAAVDTYAQWPTSRAIT
jgi:hypothetical protein